jgi:hypothetical protein
MRELMADVAAVITGILVIVLSVLFALLPH